MKQYEFLFLAATQCYLIYLTAEKEKGQVRTFLLMSIFFYLLMIFHMFMEVIK